MVFEGFWSRENRTLNGKFTLVQHPIALGPFHHGIWVLLVKRKPYFQSQIHTNATSHGSRAIPVWYLSASGHEKTVLSIANSHQCNIPCLLGHSTMVFEGFWSRENRTFNRKFLPMQHPMSLGPFHYGIWVLLVKRKPYLQSQIHTNATSHVCWALPIWFLRASGHEKTVLSIANSH